MPLTKTRIMVFGTFDLLHPGHEDFFRQARALASQPYLIVSVARDKNVLRIKNQPALYSETERLAAVRQNPLVDKVVLGGVRTSLPHIVRERPHIIALGYDQREYVRGLRAGLQQYGLKIQIIRLQPYQPHRYKSSKLKRKIRHKLN